MNFNLWPYSDRGGGQRDLLGSNCHLKTEKRTKFWNKTTKTTYPRPLHPSIGPTLHRLQHYTIYYHHIPSKALLLTNRKEMLERALLSLLSPCFTAWSLYCCIIVKKKQNSLVKIELKNKFYVPLIMKGKYFQVRRCLSSKFFSTVGQKYVFWRLQSYYTS